MAADEEKKSKSKKSSKVKGGFEVHRESATLTSEMSRKVVRYANKRMTKSKIKEFVGDCEGLVDTLQHSQLDLGECLGQGSFSSVYEIRELRSDDKSYDAEKLVVKVLRSKLSANPPMLSACAADLVKEGMIMASLSHRNVLNAQAWSPKGVGAFINGRHDAFFLVLDRLEFTLSDRLRRWQKQAKKISYSFTHRQSKKAALLQERIDVLLELSDAVQYMHSKRVLHRDLKPDNIGFDRDDVLKVFDFDVARIVPESSVPDETFSLTKRVGSPRYMSPECARGEEYNMMADVYTFGLLCHELLTLEKPYEDLPSGQHDELVFYAGVRPIIPKNWSKGMKTLLQRCWTDDLLVRPRMEEVREILDREIPSMFKGKGKKQAKSSKPSSSRSVKKGKTPVVACA